MKQKNITTIKYECGRLVVGLLIGVSSLVGACNQCSKSNIERKGDAVSYEQLRFGVDEDTFLRESLSLIPLEHAPSKEKSCKDQVSMLFPDLDEKSVTERVASKGPITTCLVRSHHLKQTSTLIEIRGEFLDGKLSRMTFSFDKSRYQSLESALKMRFGEGDSMRLVEQVIIEDEEKTYQYWTDEKEIWLLSDRKEDPIVLIRQDLLSGQRGLKKRAPVPKKGVPISLDDIGIGKLDLNDAPLPDLTGIEIPDGGSTSSKRPPPGENSETQQ